MDHPAQAPVLFYFLFPPLSNVPHYHFTLGFNVVAKVERAISLLRWSWPPRPSLAQRQKSSSQDCCQKRCRQRLLNLSAQCTWFAAQGHRCAVQHYPLVISLANNTLKCSSFRSDHLAWNIPFPSSTNPTTAQPVSSAGTKQLFDMYTYILFSVNSSFPVYDSVPAASGTWTGLIVPPPPAHVAPLLWMQSTVQKCQNCLCMFAVILHLFEVQMIKSRML